MLCLVAMSSLIAAAQGSVKGKIIDRQSNEALQFVNIKVNQAKTGKMVKGSVTDGGGAFNITGLADGDYVLEASYIGYKPATRKFTISAGHRQSNFPFIYLGEDSQVLKEVQVTGQRSQMKLEVDRKTFTVDQVLAAAGGSASDLLENIPSVEIDTDGEISLRSNTSVEVWINGKASGLTPDNRAESAEPLKIDDSKFSPDQCVFDEDGIYWSFIRFEGDTAVIHGCGELYRFARPAIDDPDQTEWIAFEKY